MQTLWQRRICQYVLANERAKMPTSQPTDPIASWYRNQPLSKRMPE
jgi:hypothetical protein